MFGGGGRGGGNRSGALEGSVLEIGLDLSKARRGVAHNGDATAVASFK